MKISINLATRPYVELGPYYQRLRIVMAALVVVAVAAFGVGHLEQAKLDAATAQMDLLKAQTSRMQNEKSTNVRRMRQPANAAVLDRAHFLNALFLRKSFSWTAVMMDLERVLPAGVQVTSIEPGVTADGAVLIRMRVSGDRDRAVQLVRNLERSERFRQPRLTGEAVQAKEAQANLPMSATAAPGVDFEIVANYNPLPEDESYTKAEKSGEGKPQAEAAGRPSAAAENYSAAAGKHSAAAAKHGAAKARHHAGAGQQGGAR
jgi:type IV pilus assembly protein PilN